MFGVVLEERHGDDESAEEGAPAAPAAAASATEAIERLFVVYMIIKRKERIFVLLILSSSPSWKRDKRIVRFKRFCE